MLATANELTTTQASALSTLSFRVRRCSRARKSPGFASSPECCHWGYTLILNVDKTLVLIGPA